MMDCNNFPNIPQHNLGWDLRRMPTVTLYHKKSQQQNKNPITEDMAYALKINMLAHGIKKTRSSISTTFGSNFFSHLHFFSSPLPCQ
jgi:hypothetical protein